MREGSWGSSRGRTSEPVVKLLATAYNRMFICDITYLEVATVIVTVGVDDHETNRPFEDVRSTTRLQRLSAYCSGPRGSRIHTSTVHHFSFWSACNSFMSLVFAILNAKNGEGEVSLGYSRVYDKVKVVRRMKDRVLS